MSTADDEDIVAPVAPDGGSGELDRYVGLAARGLSRNPGAQLLLDTDFNVVFANEAACGLWNLESSKIVGRAIADLISDGETTTDFLRGLQSDGTWSGELAAMVSDGSRADLLANANAVDDDNGGLAGYLCVLFDVGERRGALRRLEHGQDMFSTISESAKFVVFEMIPETGIYRIVGDSPLLPLAPDEKTRSSLEARLVMYGPEERAKLEAAIETILSVGALPSPLEVLATFSDGTSRWFRHDGWLASAPGKKPARILGWSRDVTEEKKALLELERLEERYALAAEFSKTMVFELLPEERKLHASGAVRLMPISDSDWESDSMDARMALFHPDDADDVREHVVAIIMGKADSGEIEARVPFPDESIHWLSIEFHLATRAKGGPTRIIGIARDITEQKEAEIALRESEERNALALRYVRMAAWEIYPDDGKLIADGNFMALLGQPGAEPPSDLEVVMDTVYPADRSRVEKALQDVFDGHADSFTTEHRTILADGSIEWRRDEGHVASRPGEPLRVIGTSLDITDQREAEEQLQQAQKMETVGQLSAGVAHDFNNLLAVVLGNVELAIEALSDDPRLSDLLEQALAAGERGAELTRHLLAFSRRQTLYPEVVELDTVLGDLLRLVERTIGRGVDVIYRPNNDLQQVFIDRSQLESAILNLALNARDAMSKGGTLTISAKNVMGPNENSETSSSDAFVCVEVADTGMGMNEDVLAQAFQPFFTTKDVGKGSGLGLSMVHGFAEQSGGHVELESVPGQGTSVKLFLPVSTGNETGGRRRQSDGVHRAGKGHTVLVVDDDEHVRSVVAKLVRSLGYEVTLGRNAEEALNILSSSHAIALLLTDVVLGSGMDGVALALEAKRRFPNLETLCMSGHAESDVLDGYDEAEHLTIISKPFTKALLSEHIEGVLSASSGAELPPV